MKSYYIKSINLWIISVNIGLLSSDAKENIRKEWLKQVHSAKDVVVIDQSIAPFEIIDDVNHHDLKDVASIAYLPVGSQG